MSKLMSLAVCLAISTSAFPAGNASATEPANIKAEIGKRGTGEKARVQITTRDHRRVSG